MVSDPEGGNARVLVVEDDPEYRAYLEATLTRDGHQPLFVTDGAAALDVIGEFRPNLLITDLAMPGIDGLELCRRVRALSDWARLPILVLSGAEESASIGDVVGLGLIWYLRKGATLDHFRKTLRNLITRAEEGPDLT